MNLIKLIKYGFFVLDGFIIQMNVFVCFMEDNQFCEISENIESGIIIGIFFEKLKYELISFFYKLRELY